MNGAPRTTKTFDSDSIRKAATVVWSHASAGVAVLLIIGALFLGYHWGKPPVSPETTSSASDDAGVGKPQLYTCSMHPSVRLPDPDAKCPICFMELIAVANDSGGEGSERRIVIDEAAVKRSEIETATVGRMFPTAEVRLYGLVTYDETSVARMTAYFPGRLDRLFINFVGIGVTEGDHVAEIYSPDLLSAFEELRQAVAAVGTGDGAASLAGQVARDTLAASRDKLRLFGLTEEQIQAVESGEFNGDSFTIYSPITGVVTHLGALEGDYVQTGEPIATVANLDRVWLDLEAYESQLSLLSWGQEVRFEVESYPGERFVGHITFIAPVVDKKTRTAAVRIAVANDDRKLKPGMFASAVARPRIATGGVLVSDEFAGRWVSPMHPTIVKDGPGQCDVCGMDLVTAESLGIVGDPSLVVEPIVIPRTSVLFTGVRSVVYVRVPDTERPTYEGRVVVLGPRAGEYYTVRSGLEVGEEVVTRGAFRIDSSMQIAAKPSMMLPAGGGGGVHLHEAGSKTGAAVPETFMFGIKPVYATCLDAQEALATDDLESYRLAEQDVATAVGLVEVVGLFGSNLGEWRRVAAKLRFDKPAASIGEARLRFKQMAEAVVMLERHFGHFGSDSWFLAYCPMAFDGAGAEWMQRGKQISNPYFGAAMLRCGEIRDEFPPKKLDEHADGEGPR